MPIISLINFNDSESFLSLDQIENLKDQISGPLFLALFEKWGLILILISVIIFSLLMTKQMTLLFQFLPTEGGRRLKRFSLFYSFLTIITLIAVIILI